MNPIDVLRTFLRTAEEKIEKFRTALEEDAVTALFWGGDDIYFQAALVELLPYVIKRLEETDMTEIHKYADHLQERALEKFQNNTYTGVTSRPTENARAKALNHCARLIREI
jgi:selenocysteine lyase/cysteine desulfurase